MTEPISSPESGPAVATPNPPGGRPGIVTAAGITLIVLGALTLVLSLILLLGAAIFAGAAGGVDTEVPGLGGMFGAFAGAIFVVVLIVVGFGALQLISGIKVLGGQGWARITGIVVAVIAGVLALAGVGDPNGAILNIALVAANAFVVYALITTGPWFAR